MQGFYVHVARRLLWPAYQGLSHKRGHAVRTHLLTHQRGQLTSAVRTSVAMPGLPYYQAWLLAQELT